MAAHDSYQENPGKDDLAFERLVDQFYQSLFRFAMSLTGQESDACDLVQETFAIYAKKGWQLQQATKAKSWLFTTLHRRFLEGRRRVTRFPEVGIEAAEGELPDVDPHQANLVDAGTVLELLEQLDPHYRAAVALFYLEDYSYQEIAEILDIPMGTVKSRIARGLGELKRLFAVQPPPDTDRREPKP